MSCHDLPVKLFLVTHEYVRDGCSEGKDVGLFKTRERAEEVLAGVASQPGFIDHPDGWSILEYELIAGGETYIGDMGALINVWSLFHVWTEDECEMVHLIGLYASEALALSALTANRSDIKRDEWWVNQWPVGYVGWSEGFKTVYS